MNAFSHLLFRFARASLLPPLHRCMLCGSLDQEHLKFSCHTSLGFCLLLGPHLVLLPLFPSTSAFLYLLFQDHRLRIILRSRGRGKCKKPEDRNRVSIDDRLTNFFPIDPMASLPSQLHLKIQDSYGVPTEPPFPDVSGRDTRFQSDETEPRIIRPELHAWWDIN